MNTYPRWKPSNFNRSGYGAAAELHDFQPRGLGNVRFRSSVGRRWDQE